MSRKKTIAAVGISMLDLVSNALAAVIILFFILATSRFPESSPVRTCGTILAKFTVREGDPGFRCHTYVKYQPPDGYKSIINGYCFDTNIINLSDEILALPFSQSKKCHDDSTIIEHNIPPIRSYQDTKERNMKILILRDPPSGNWELGLLYNEHEIILDDTMPKIIQINIYYYNESKLYRADTTLTLVSPTASVFAKIEINESLLEGNGSIKGFGTRD